MLKKNAQNLFENILHKTVSKERNRTVRESHDPCFVGVSIERKSSTTPQVLPNSADHSPKCPRGARVRGRQRNPEPQLSEKISVLTKSRS